MLTDQWDLSLWFLEIFYKTGPAAHRCFYWFIVSVQHVCSLYIDVTCMFGYMSFSLLCYIKCECVKCLVIGCQYVVTQSRIMLKKLVSLSGKKNLLLKIVSIWTISYYYYLHNLLMQIWNTHKDGLLTFSCFPQTKFLRCCYGNLELPAFR